MATITGQRARSILPACDTPRDADGFSPRRDEFPHAPEPAQSARAAWCAVTPRLAGTPHVRVSRDGGRTYPARHVRPLSAEPPGQPCTVPVYEAATGTGRMLALDLDPSRGRGSGDPRAQADAIAQLLTRLGGRYITDVSPSGGRHLFVVFAVALPWRELRDVPRALALRFPAPMSSAQVVTLWAYHGAEGGDIGAICFPGPASEPTWRAGRRATGHSPPEPAKMLTVTGLKATGGAFSPVTQRGPR